MTTDIDIREAMAEMDFEIVDNGVLELPSSKPATFRVSGEATPDTDALEDSLDEHDFGLMQQVKNSRDDGRFYCHFHVVTDHYKRVRVKTWNDSVRIYPDEELPDTFEFVRIIKAIEDAFGVELEHDPQDGDE
jgi:hypothetical protein